MGKLRFSIAIFCVLSILSCKKSYESSYKYRIHTGDSSSKNFVIPRALRTDIEKMYLEFIRKENPKIVLPDEDIVSRIPREFLDVEVTFHAESPGVLSDQAKFMFPRGGGEINLKDIVVGEKGSFYMNFKIKHSGEESGDLISPKYFFLSESPKRHILRETYGAGCKTYMDITKVVLSSQKSGGIRLNATDQRYLSVVGGIFYFVDFNPDRKIYLAAVRITDSRYPHLLCPEGE